MLHYPNDNSSKKIPSKYNKILKFVSANTKKPFYVVKADFLSFYKQSKDPLRYHRALVLLHRKYVQERDLAGIEGIPCDHKKIDSS